MKKSHLLGAVCALSILAPIPSFAAIVNLTASLDGVQAYSGAGSGSAGTGSATMTLDDVTSLFSWNISWSGLSGSATNMHFHGPAAAGASAGVTVPIPFGSNPAIGSSTLSASQVPDLLAGLWYINIHTANDPSGEIRGQVQVVPVPAAVWLFGSGLLGLIGFARKRAA